jgi:O-methyltransferase
MNTFQYLNLLLINAIAWVIMSYFWSYWTHKLFKPYKWLEFNKKKEIPAALVRAEKKEKDKIQLYALWLQLERINRHQIPGDLAEVGVNKGETARIIHHMLPDRQFHLFDSFDGLPLQVVREDCDGTVRPQTIKFDNTSPEEVSKTVNGNSNIHIYKGIFPETAQPIFDHTFAFVHLDAYLYQTTLDWLRFFYERLSPGGVIMVHDYNHDWEGVTKAVNDFMNEVPEEFVEIPDQLGSAILIKNRLSKQ